MNEEFEAGSQHWICPTRPQMTLVQTNNVPLNLLLDDIWAHAISRYSSPLPLSKIPPKPYRIPRWAVHVPSGPTKGELHAWSISTCGQWPRDNNRRSLCSTLKSTSLDGILYLGWGHDRIWYTIINQGAWKQWNRNVRHMCNDSPHWCKMDRRREKKNVSFHDFSFEPTMETSGQCVCQQNTYLNLMRPHHLFQWVLYLGSWSPGQHPSQRLLQIIPTCLIDALVRVHWAVAGSSHHAVPAALTYMSPDQLAVPWVLPPTPRVICSCSGISWLISAQ